MDMHNVNLQQYLMDIKGILVYISDIETDELYYLNSIGEKLFGLEKKDWEHKKYYEVLHILRSADSPSNTELLDNKAHVWQPYISFLDKHFRIHVILTEINGKKVRLGMAQDITESVLLTLNMEDKLREQTIVHSYLDTLLKPLDITITINSLLEMVCDYYQADRVHVAHIPTEECTIKEVFEYIKINNAQASNIFHDLTDGNIMDWFAKYSEQGIACISTTSNLQTVSEFHALSDSNEFILIPLYQERSTSNDFTVKPLNDNQKTIIAFIVIENPKTRSENKQLISSISKLYENFYLKTQMKQALLKLSYCDSMTQLLNRNSFEERYKELATQKYINLGVIYLDINGLKHTNDTKGHKAGDELICLCAHTLKSVFQDNLYRTGGDEFIVILEDIPEADFQKRVAHLEATIAENSSVSLAVGYLWNDGSIPISDHLQKADLLMYQSKKQYYTSINKQCKN